MVFLLSEDKALREKMQGMMVSDQKASGEETPRQVGVWFGQPDQEIRTQNYPYITIDMIDIARDPEREMRGKISPDYLKPEGLPENQGFEIDIPIPVILDYQITTYARHPRHDRALVAQLLIDRLPMRTGILELDDGTVRRLDVLDVAKRDLTENQKRTFINSFTVRVSSEIVQGNLVELYKVLGINISSPTGTNGGGRPGDPNFIGFETINISE
jgi:hypothetical protein